MLFPRSCGLQIYRQTDTGCATYKLATIRIPMVAIFFRIGICRFHRYGIGRIRTAMFVTISRGDAPKYMSLSIGRHWPPLIVLSHQKAKGLQLRNRRSSLPTSHVMTTKPMALEMWRKRRV